MAHYAFVPGAVAANTATAMPGDAPAFYSVTSVVVLTEATGGTASTTSPVQATVVDAIPAGGLGATDFYLDTATNAWQYGSATTDGTVFLMNGFEVGQMGRTS
ncbi:hypothetical protein [Sulfobacillus harzensis]|uniref:Uncharacterized protein n=1 Tax=Sulfobacillus harzensis TaxID=2729629 RepID=A0A7Y0Q3H7_9FIRM|nr:hypothetical protein [Sulfobacillus harzensis]NMP22204.1 hypothetical protein [Sulfobacillus harzensis]